MNELIHALAVALLGYLVAVVAPQVWRRLHGKDDEVGSDCGHDPVNPTDAKTRRLHRALGEAAARARFR